MPRVVRSLHQPASGRRSRQRVFGRRGICVVWFSLNPVCCSPDETNGRIGGTGAVEPARRRVSNFDQTPRQRWA
jgi:hypothetical protein